MSARTVSEALAVLNSARATPGRVNFDWTDNRLRPPFLDQDAA